MGMFQMLYKEHNHVDLEPNLQDRKVHLHRQASPGSLLLKNQSLHQSYMNNIRLKIKALNTTYQDYISGYISGYISIYTVYTWFVF